MIKINEAFVCKNCKKANDKAQKTCRNHCKFCLYSLHVDKTIPGDRKSGCLSLMEPKYIDYHTNKGFQIIHKCLKCGKEIPNKTADDDNRDLIGEIMQEQNILPPSHQK
jgi:DNA-directed RNA polymerase subunit RPC12/RpoP